MVSPSQSAVTAVVLAVICAAAVHVTADVWRSSPAMTIAGGAVSSTVFLFLLTAVGNFKTMMGYTTGIIEVVIALFLSASSAAIVHPVCFTTCIIFSLLLLSGMNSLSQSTYRSAAAATSPAKQDTKRRRR